MSCASKGVARVAPRSSRAAEVARGSFSAGSEPLGSFPHAGVWRGAARGLSSGEPLRWLSELKRSPVRFNYLPYSWTSDPPQLEPKPAEQL